LEMPDPMAERGRGLALAQAVLEELNYRRTHLNHWTLVSKPFG
jgi:anti-sigma regulatory factor (Ser/Thr protein kinase)